MKFQFNKNIKIGNFDINPKSSTFIIAEAGVNHNGDMDLAKKLVDVAVSCGVDAVKFQAFKTEELILENISKAPYQVKQTGSSETQFQMLKKLEMGPTQMLEIKKYCQEKGILFLVTPFDEVSLEEVDQLGVEAFKISSTDLTNLPFLRRVAAKGKPIILSTGMSYLSEIELALQEINALTKDVILLHCTANYPVPAAEVNLNVLKTYSEHFDILTGYSDHSIGIGASPYSLPLGAKVIEKHFTLDKKMPGPDHEASLNPEELKLFVSEIRKVEQFLGSSIKSPQLSEVHTRNSLQKCLVAKKKICEGDIFTEDNVVAKRTGGQGISPVYSKDVFGKASKYNFEKDSLIRL